MADISITGKSGDTLLDVKASNLRSGEAEIGSCYGIGIVYCGALLGV
jgi:hypothetical protein